MRKSLFLLLIAITAGLVSPSGAEDRVPPTHGPLLSVSPDTAASAKPAANPALHPRRDHQDGIVSLREKIGQMILIGFPGSAPGEAWPVRIRAMVRSGKIGGVVLFARNIVDPDQVKELTQSLRQAGRFPPFIGIDQEGGTIQRLTRAKDFRGLPSAEHIASLDQQKAFRFYEDAARELAENGINVNFGPVADLNVNPNNPAIGKLRRSFGADTAKVVSYSQIFIDAHHAMGVLTSAKHFPGHGSARLDPHEDVVDISRTWDEKELGPFRLLLHSRPVDMVMVGHLIHPRFSDRDADGKLRPSSLSRLTIQSELRGKLNYSGLVVTDDLDMAAIRERYGVPQAAAMAVEAGADLIIVANNDPPDPEIADRIIAAILRAVDAKRISPDEIERSYRRILAAKEKIARHRVAVSQ